MEVNDELAVLRRAIPAAIDAIGVGGRVVVESYHSLEDRLVKQAFTAATRSDVPEDLPFVPEGHEPALRLVTRGVGEGRRRARSSRTPAPPPCGCAPSNASTPPTVEESPDEQSRRPDPLPRPASRRGGGRAGPPAPWCRGAASGPPGCRS